MSKQPPPIIFTDSSNNQYLRDNLYVLLRAVSERYPHSDTGDWMQMLIADLEAIGAPDGFANCTIPEMKQNLQ